jgi:hypothetical protein
MGYEMYRLLNYAPDGNGKISRKKPKSIHGGDEDSSSSSDKGSKKKTTKTKLDLANIEKYRMSFTRSGFSCL